MREFNWIRERDCIERVSIFNEISFVVVIGNTTDLIGGETIKGNIINSRLFLFRVHSKIL